MKHKIAKYIEYVTILAKKQFCEKKFSYGDTTIKYIFQKENRSEQLIVVFSACTRAGVPARYNYMRTLETISCNKLFILDDFGCDKRGGYYLGLFPEFEFETATLKLLDSIIDKQKIKKCYFCGSSKGGWAALNIGLRYNNDIGNGIVVGGPQYWLGRYLNSKANRSTLEGICGKANEKEVLDVLDNYLQGRIRECSGAQKQPIYLHYSTQEHTYQDHVVDLLAELRSQNYVINEDIKNYEKHGDLSLYFPEFLKTTLAGMIV